MPKSEEDEKIQEVLRALDNACWLDCCNNSDLSAEVYYFVQSDGSRLYTIPCKQHIGAYSLGGFGWRKA
jgi:hypothetical protein